MDMQGVSKSIAYSVDVQGVFIFFHLCKVFFKCRNAWLMASCQSGTEMNQYANARIRYSPIPEEGDPVRYRKAPVLDWDTGCWNADVVGFGLDAGTQLWSLFDLVIYRVYVTCRVKIYLISGGGGEPAMQSLEYFWNIFNNIFIKSEMYFPTHVKCTL